VEVLPGVITVRVSEKPVIVPEERIHAHQAGLDPVAEALSIA